MHGRNIYLVGLMGAGKSSVARELARLLGREAADTDAEVVRAAGRSIPEIFAAEGEAGFRSREAAALALLAGRSDLVIATGGGIVLRAENRERMRATGRVFYLHAPAEELHRRVARGGIPGRPLLAGGDPLGTLRRLLAERDPLYRATAHHVMESLAEHGPAQMAERIRQVLSEEKEEETDAGTGPG